MLVQYQYDSVLDENGLLDIRNIKKYSKKLARLICFSYICGVKAVTKTCFLVKEKLYYGR